MLKDQAPRIRAPWPSIHALLVCVLLFASEIETCPRLACYFRSSTRLTRHHACRQPSGPVPHEIIGTSIKISSLSLVFLFGFLSPWFWLSREEADEGDEGAERADGSVCRRAPGGSSADFCFGVGILPTSTRCYPVLPCSLYTIWNVHRTICSNGISPFADHRTRPLRADATMAVSSFHRPTP